jgi:hypothetical protein
MTWLSGGKRVARGHAPVAKGWSSPVNEAPKTLAIWVPVKLVVRALKILVRIRVKVVVIIVLLVVLLGSLRHRRRCRLHEHAEHGRVLDEPSVEKAKRPAADGPKERWILFTRGFRMKKPPSSGYVV